MEKKKPFVVVSSSDPNKFEQGVCDYINDGYVLHGEPQYRMSGASDTWGESQRAIFKHLFFQALKLPDKL